MKLKIIGISRWVGEGVFEKIPLVGKRSGYSLELHNIKLHEFLKRWQMKTRLQADHTISDHTRKVMAKLCI